MPTLISFICISLCGSKLIKSLRPEGWKLRGTKINADLKNILDHDLKADEFILRLSLILLLWHYKYCKIFTMLHQNKWMNALLEQIMQNKVCLTEQKTTIMIDSYRYE